MSAKGPVGINAADMRFALVFPDQFVMGTSAAMASVYEMMQWLAPSDIPTMIRGETGVGKELIARTLHHSSRRGRGPFVAVNCAAVPAELLEAELFGVEQGTATGVRARLGMFRRADGGTIFLDEIGDMSPALQAKMLRALEERAVQPVGGQPSPVDVRLLSATHVDVAASLAAGSLRPDLYYRLAGEVIEVPPLRDRDGDIEPLFRRFLDRFASVAEVASPRYGEDVRHCLDRYPWPGNVRELVHEAQRLVYRCAAAGRIDLCSLPQRLLRAGAAPGGACGLPAADAIGGQRTGVRHSDAALGKVETRFDLGRRIEALERDLIQQAYQRTHGHHGRAARLLGISRNGLTKKVARLGIQRFAGASSRLSAEDV